MLWLLLSLWTLWEREAHPQIHREPYRRLFHIRVIYRVARKRLISLVDSRFIYRSITPTYRSITAPPSNGLVFLASEIYRSITPRRAFTAGYAQAPCRKPVALPVGMGGAVVA